MSYRIQDGQIKGAKEIVISGWEKGTASTPYGGINDIRAVNVSDIPGAVSTTLKYSQYLGTPPLVNVLDVISLAS